MTDKLHCPFCGAELKNACAQVIYYCPTGECKAKDWYASKQVWQALIQAKQDLEIVVDALKPFADRDNWDFEHCFLDNPQLLAGTALEQIEHKEQQ